MSEGRPSHVDRVQGENDAGLCGFACSSIGSKFVVGASGTFLLLFVVGHMVGNLQIFLGQDVFNTYAAFLKGKPAMLWGVRLFLSAVLVLHVGVSIRLALANRNARPVPYAFEETVQASYASRTMFWSGPIILAFVIYHLLHFTVGRIQPELFTLHDAQGRHDVYSMVIRGFQHPAVAASYFFAVALLGMHLWHGVSSLFQTFGVSHPRLDPWLVYSGPVVALFLVGGYVSVPIAAYLGILRPAVAQ